MEIRLLTKRDLAKLVDLYDECFSDTINIQFFDWKYFQNPIGTAKLAGIFENNSLIASGALIPEKIEINGEITFVQKFTDLMTSPFHRKKGLSKKIVGFLTTIGIEENGIVYTICSKAATQSFLKMDWNYVDKVIYFFKPLFFNFLSKQNEIEFFDSKNIDINLISINNIDPYLVWRMKNPKFNYLVAIDKFKKIILFSIRNKNAFVVHSDYNLDTPNFKNIISNSYSRLKQYGVNNLVFISIVQKKEFKFLFKYGFLYNFLNKGKMSSILDFNIIFTENQKKSALELRYQFTPNFYDDI